MIVKSLREFSAAACIFVLGAAPAAAQFGAPPAAPPAANGRSQVCLRLESQLATIDRGAYEPAKAEQIKRLEDAAAKQQSEVDRLGQQAQKLGCQGAGFFALFSGQSPQCGPVNNQMQQMRANLDRSLMDIQRLQGNSGEREGQRRGILAALGQNDCGPQYRQYANSGPGGFFEQLFGGGPSMAPSGPLSGTYRTVCVRTCDGFYFPISYSTVPGKFADDERLCQRLCPATEVALYSYRNPGEDVARAVSTSGRLYSDLSTAFSYRKQYNAACSCRLPGQSWAEALKAGSSDDTVERGDVVVTEERAKKLSLPRFDAQGKPINSDRPGAAPNNPAAATNSAAPATETAPPAEEQANEDRSKRKVRSVGPNFYPVR
jgi:hypothetical protein